MIDRMIHRKRIDITLKSTYPIPSENPNNKCYKLTYVKGISNKIINILKNIISEPLASIPTTLTKSLPTTKIKQINFPKVVSIVSIVTNVMLSITVKLAEIYEYGLKTF